MVVCDTWDYGVGDVLDWISATSVFGERGIVIVDDSALRIEDDVFENGTETNSVENFRFFFAG